MSTQHQTEGPIGPPTNLEAASTVRADAAKPDHILGDFLEQDEAAAELKVCRRTLDRWRRLAQGPPITRLGRRILYRRSSLLAWLYAREHGGQHEAA